MPHKLCALCYRTYVNLKQHLTVSHNIPNKQEFALLIKYGNARTTALLNCPICDKQSFVRLDKHLQHTHGMGSTRDRDSIIMQAKRLAIVKEFVELRNSDPDPPFVSNLGLCIDSEPDGPLDLRIDAEHPRCSTPIPTASDSVAQQAQSFQCAPVSSNDGIISNAASEESAGTQQLSVSTPKSLSCESTGQAAQPFPDSSSGTPLASIPPGTVPASSTPMSTSPAGTVPASFTPMSTSPATAAPGSAGEKLSESQPGPSDSPSSREQPEGSTMSGPWDTPTQPESCGGNNDSGFACSCRCEELARRVETLEHQLLGHKLDRSDVRKSRESLQRTPQYAQKWEHVRKAAKTGTLYYKVIDDFQTFRLGGRTGRKDIDNARQSAGHCLRYCQYMVGGLPEKSTSLDLRFLARMDKLRSYPTYLKSKGYMPTTIKNMMINIGLFYKHIEHSFLRSSKLKTADLSRVLYELKRLQAEIHRDVVVHQQQVKRKRTENKLDSAQELAFLRTAKKKIPELFGILSQGMSPLNEHSKLMGYVMGYLCIISGHRSIVLTNMLKEHVSNADSWMDGKKFQILVDEHKTVKTFGQASLVLNRTEFSWLEQLAQGKCCTSGAKSRHVVHTILGGEITKPINFLCLAWSDAGCTGKVSFSMIRSSVATQADKHLTESERRKVARSMCHDPNTAEKFYVALPDRDVAYETRQLRMKALMLENKKGKAPPNLLSDESFDTPSESSSEDEVPVYNDEPDSSSSLSSEELQVMRERRVRSKKQLTFSSAKNSPKKDATTEIITPSKIQVTVERLKPSNQEYYCNKWRVTVDVPGEDNPEPLGRSDAESMSFEGAHPGDEPLMQSTSDSEPFWGTQEARDNFDFQNEVLVKDTPASQYTPASQETPVIQETPASQEIPAIQETPASQETPVIQETPASQDTPASQETPATQETPASQETPATQETPASQEMPASQETPANRSYTVLHHLEPSSQPPEIVASVVTPHPPAI